MRQFPADDGFPIQAMWTPAQWTQHGVLYLMAAHLNPLSLFFRGDRSALTRPVLVVEAPAPIRLVGPLCPGRGPLPADREPLPTPVPGKKGQLQWRFVLPSCLLTRDLKPRFVWTGYYHLCADVTAAPGFAGSLRWHFEDGKRSGPSHELRIRVRRAPEPPPPNKRFRLYVQHTGPLRHPNAGVRKGLVAYLRTAGIRGGLALSYYDPSLQAADAQLAALGMHMHTWRFEGYQGNTTPATALVTVQGKTRPGLICPEAQLAHSPDWYAALRRYYQAKLATGLQRIIIDYEPPTFDCCFCPRCRAAFQKRFGLNDPEIATMPARALRDRYPRKWARFRAEQNGAIVKLHCKLIRSIAPHAEIGLCSWDGTAASAAMGGDIREFEPAVSFHAPMIYTKGTAFHDRIAETCRRTRAPVLPFIELADISQPRSLTPADLRMNLLATGLSGGRGAFLWVGMECLDAEYMAAVAEAANALARLEKQISQGSPPAWIRTAPATAAQLTVLMIDGKPMRAKTPAVQPQVRVHTFGGKTRATVVFLNYATTSAPRMQVSCTYPARFSLGFVTPDTEHAVLTSGGDDRRVRVTLPPLSAVTVFVARIDP